MKWRVFQKFNGFDVHSNDNRRYLLRRSMRNIIKRFRFNIHQRFVNVYEIRNLYLTKQINGNYHLFISILILIYIILLIIFCL